MEERNAPTAAGKSRSRLLLPVAAGLVLLALLAAGIFFFFLQQSPEKESGRPAGGPATGEEDGGNAAESGDTGDGQAELEAGGAEYRRIEPEEERDLDAILAEYYTGCQDDDIDASQIAGFGRLRTCPRGGGDHALTLLQVYQLPDPETPAELRSPERWCGEKTAKRLSAIRGEDFAIVFVSLVNLRESGAPEPEDIFSPEYIRRGNEILEDEYEFLAGQGLRAELVNACKGL